MEIWKNVTGFVALILVIGFFTSCASTQSMYVVEDIPLEGVGGIVIKEFKGEGGRLLTNALLSKFRMRANKNDFIIWDERQYDEVIRKGGDPTLIKPTAYLSGEVLVCNFSNSEKQYKELTDKISTKYEVQSLQRIFEPKGVATVVVNFEITDIQTGKNITAKTIDARKANSLLAPKSPDQLLLLTINKVAGNFVNSIKQ